MNESKMIEVLARIEDESERFARREEGAVGFNMSDWYNEEYYDQKSNICGTTACLAGHAYIAAGYTAALTDDRYREESISDIGQQVLGLSCEDADHVFCLADLEEVYDWVADQMGVELEVLKDKVQGERKYA